MDLYLLHKTLILDLDLSEVASSETNNFENGRHVTIYNCDIFNRFGVGISGLEARNDLLRSITLFFSTLFEQKQLISFLQKKGFQFITPIDKLICQDIKVIDRKYEN